MSATVPHTAPSLPGVRAIVSGGSSGIGLWIAHELAAAGADLALVARDEQRLSNASALLAEKYGHRVFTKSVDVRQTEAVTGAVEDLISDLGGLDLLVNTAATPAGSIDNLPIEQTDPEYALNELNIKAIGYLRTIRAAVPTFKRQGHGRIVNIGGQSVQQTGNLIATLRNSAVAAISANLASELGGFGITTNLIHPGHTITDPPSNDGDAAVLNAIAASSASGSGNNLGRLVHAKEIGDLVVFLASQSAVIINGESFFLGKNSGQIFSHS